MEFVAADRKTESRTAYYDQLTDAQKTALRAVAMDMWEPYIGATRDRLPAGETRIVFDRFHIMRDDESGGHGAEAASRVSQGG